MRPTTLPLLLILATAGCMPSGSGTSEAPVASTDKAMADSTRTEGQAARPQVKWRLSTSDPSAVVFDTGDTMRMHAKDLHFITRLTSPLGKLWFLFSGIDNADSDGLRALYVVSPGDSVSRGLRHSWHMPGRLTDSTGAAVYYEASVFVGQILPDTIGVVWYDRSLMPDGQWRSNTTLLQLGRPEPDTLVLFGQGRKSATIDLAVRGKCLALAPIDQRTTPH
jgi:hypothetical protein